MPEYLSKYWEIFSANDHLSAECVLKVEITGCAEGTDDECEWFHIHVTFVWWKCSWRDNIAIMAEVIVRIIWHNNIIDMWNFHLIYLTFCRYSISILFLICDLGFWQDQKTECVAHHTVPEQNCFCTEFLDYPRSAPLPWPGALSVSLASWWNFYPSLCFFPSIWNSFSCLCFVFTLLLPVVLVLGV